MFSFCIVGVSFSIWDWEQGTRINTFSNRNQRHTRVTYAEFLNTDDQALMMTGSGMYQYTSGDGGVGRGVRRVVCCIIHARLCWGDWFLD